MTFDAPGFLQRTSTLGGDLNLIAQLVQGLTLVVGVVLGCRGHCRAHGVCQTTALALTLLLTVDSARN